MSNRSKGVTARPSEYVTVPEALAAFPYSRSTIERWIASGRLTVIQPFAHARRRLLRAELEAYLRRPA